MSDRSAERLRALLWFSVYPALGLLASYSHEGKPFVQGFFYMTLVGVGAPLFGALLPWRTYFQASGRE